MKISHFSGESVFQRCGLEQDQPGVDESVDRVEYEAYALPEAATFPDKVVDGQKT